MTYNPNRILDLRFFGFDAAGNVADRSGYGFDFADNAFAGDDSEFVDGQYGQALNLVPNKYLSYALQAGDVLDFRFGFTYELWLRRTANIGVRQTIMGKTTGPLGVDIAAVMELFANDTVVLRVGDGVGSTNVASASTILDTNLHHIVCTWDMATSRISIDGNEDNAGASPFATIKSCVGFNFAINLYPNAGVLWGNIEYEAIRVYNRVLGASEIRSNYQYGPNRT